MVAYGEGGWVERDAMRGRKLVVEKSAKESKIQRMEVRDVW